MIVHFYATLRQIVGKREVDIPVPESASLRQLVDYQGCLPEVKRKILDMAVNGSGIRDTARVLNISPSTVIIELKITESALESVNRAVLERLNPSDILVKIQKVEQSEEAVLDEMWSYVGNKENQRWLWHAIDHHSGEVLAYVFGNHEDAVFLELKKLLEPFGITTFYTDDWGAYERHLPATQRVVGKANTQKIERKHLTSHSYSVSRSSALE